jgi:hypothetical protein
MFNPLAKLHTVGAAEPLELELEVEPELELDAEAPPEPPPELELDADVALAPPPELVPEPLLAEPDPPAPAAPVLLLSWVSPPPQPTITHAVTRGSVRRSNLFMVGAPVARRSAIRAWYHPYHERTGDAMRTR